MDLLLKRSYDLTGCNGRLFQDGKFKCFTIELPWRGNLRNRSCIPEGCYPLLARHSLKWGNHIEIGEVPGRNHILFHPANYAHRQLRGCIAPVSTLTGIGEGSRSAIAHDRLKELVLPVLERGQQVYINILNDCYERSSR